MPYFFDKNLDDENKDPSQLQISGASTTADAESSTPNSPSGNREQKTGSGFQNLDKYLTSNPSQQFGSQFVGKVGDQVKDASQKMSDASQQFKNQVTSSNQLPTQEQLNQVIEKPETANIDQFKGWANQSYTGPNSLAESQDAWNKYWSGTNQANASAKALGSEAGRFSLLDQYFGRPTYNFGQKSLDNLLVQNSGVGKQTKAIQNQATQLKSQGADQAKALQGFAADRAGQVEQNRNNVLNTIGINADGSVKTGADAGAIGREWQSIDDYVAQQNNQRKGEVENLRGGLGSGVLTQDQLKALGLSADTNLYNVDLRNYLTGGSDLTKDQVMTPEQRARLKALSNLAGITDTYGGNAPVDPTAAYSFNNEKLKQDLGSTQASYQQELANAYNSIMAPAAGTYAAGQFKPVSSNLPSDIQNTYLNPGWLNQQISDLTQAINAPPPVAEYQDGNVGAVDNSEQRMRNQQQLQQLMKMKSALDQLGNQYQTNRKLTVSNPQRAGIGSPTPSLGLRR